MPNKLEERIGTSFFGESRMGSVLPFLEPEFVLERFLLVPRLQMNGQKSTTTQWKTLMT